MEKKYWVPAIERVDNIVDMIAHHPEKYRLIDIANELNINKSSIFSLLNTLEVLNWVKKEKDGTYSLGTRLGMLSPLYFKQFDFIDTFNLTALPTLERLDETLQLSILDGTEIVYLAKKEGSSPVSITTNPGMRYPAHATAMGKVQLSQFTYEEFKGLYPEDSLKPKTQYTVRNLAELWDQIMSVKEKGFFMEYQEAVENFYCVAAPILNHESRMIASVSATVPISKWDEKKEKARAEIINLAKEISLRAGFVASIKF
ncbi:IclR family transcriptional regulator [Bacillus sp. ISL-7]|uniref:IclR family transcriptional regulator n=1 Tax=Bacillus sp. ISL-7 TaxID=2819136 RepID=UPI001BEAD10E|nr:IclR family transcriptional regulator [Bacillus sp. ISL-7]MBT2733543.1 IclR family transcriptional regulator [Bacillus sp. ISL-7]